jgi:hypothetical protein
LITRRAQVSLQILGDVGLDRGAGPAGLAAFEAPGQLGQAGLGLGQGLIEPAGLGGVHEQQSTKVTQAA